MGEVIEFKRQDVLGVTTIEVATRNGEVDQVFHPDDMTQKELVRLIFDALWIAANIDGGEDELLVEIQLYGSGRIVTRSTPDMLETREQIAWLKTGLDHAEVEILK